MSKSELNDIATVKQLGGCTGKGFKPGQSGNPGGRKKNPEFQKAIKEALEDTDPKTRQQNIVVIVNKAVEMAKAGNLPAMRWLSDRLDGTPRQSINVDNSQYQEPIRVFMREVSNLEHLNNGNEDGVDEWHVLNSQNESISKEDIIKDDKEDDDPKP